MKEYYDVEDNKYLELNLGLGQGLIGAYSYKDNTILIVDPDVKNDGTGKPYTDVLELTDRMTSKQVNVGIVQIITKEKAVELVKLFDILELDR